MVLDWAYGVTTVPERRGNLLNQTLTSLVDAGFANPRLFVDGGKINWSDEFSLAVTCRFPRIRCAGNWILSLWELYIRQPLADRYVIFQDDLIAYKNLRQYLEQSPYPERGYCNLYTCTQNQRLSPGKGWFPSNQKGKGAVALMFSLPAVVTLLCQPHLVKRCQPAVSDPERYWQNIDGGVVDSMAQAGWQEYCHDPSLVQHMGQRSTMGGVSHPAPAWRGEGFDALSLIQEQK